MSADSQRLKSALRRIVLESPELRELLGDSDNRGDQAGSAGLGTSEAEESRLCCDGSTSDNANPGTDERDADSESQEGLDPDDPADLTSGDGTLSGVTDCATGGPVCFDGSGFIPPDGWDGPDDPPIDPEWVINDQEYWSGPSPRPNFRTKGQVKEYLKSTGTLNRPVFCAFSIDTDNIVRATYDSEGGIGSCNGEIQYGLQDCATSPNAEWCGTDKGNPTEADQLLDAWPSDGCVNLALKSGTIVGSKYDPENDGSYSAPRDEIQLCSGGEQIGLKPAANGGWKTINATTDSGYLWDSHGRKIAHIDGNEYSDPDV